MNIEWCFAQLDAMEKAVEEIREARIAKDNVKRREAERQLDLLMVPVTAIADHLYDDWRWPSSTSRDYLGPRIQRLRGELIYAKEIEENLEPTAPQLHADRLHPWVWKGAQSLWASGHYADAVETAAKMVNAELQNKLGRRDISDAKLCQEAFSLEAPKETAPRLRFADDRTSESWRSRQVGAMNLSNGAFTAIRNPLAHSGDSDLPENEALELLAVFSVVARWISECEVERVK